MQSAQKKVKNSKRVLPVVERIVIHINHLFVHHVGAIGVYLSEEIYNQWVHSGKMRPSGLRSYVNALSHRIDDELTRNKFLKDAEKALLNLQSGYVL